MSKIGTAHIEIKPVLNDEALASIMQRIEDAVAEGVKRGIAKASKPGLIINWKDGVAFFEGLADESINRDNI